MYMNNREYIKAEEQTGGGTMINFVQSPYPPVTQVMKNGQKDEWISMQYDGLFLVDHADAMTPWTPPYFSGYPSTGWQGEEASSNPLLPPIPPFKAISSSSGAGGQVTDNNGESHFPRSAISTGYTSFLFADDFELGDQMFFTKSPDYLMYILPGCPNWDPGLTAEEMKGPCPRRKLQKGNFKFTVLGLMSGTDINSLNTDHPPKGYESGESPDPKTDRDVADYKTLVYRSMLDLGAMADGPNSVDAWITSKATNANMTLAEIPEGYNIANHVIHINGPQHGVIDIDLHPYYSTGSYVRNLDEAVCQPGHNPSDFQECTRDVTGFETSGDSFPAFMSKYVGAKLGDPSMPMSEIRGLGGAPVLNVEEVLEMKITLTPNTCEGRPDVPDPSWTPDVGWVGAPEGCPWWYKSTSDHNGGLEWSVHEEEVPHLNKMFKKDDMIKCETGMCFNIDFHIELGGQTLGERTIFGNPGNDVAKGHEMGTFFLYDPTVVAGGEVDWWIENLWWIIPAAGGVLILTIVSCCVCCCRRRGYCGGQTTLQKEMKMKQVVAENENL
ncbi:hypothetical protein TrVE_jg1351 [Triparma verrucosa]|uniref:Uncharacterized protein n=1 Tax=Triparma verrucosa TaxID=1606542 RepID=A0A9W7FIA8_9STRA|nr:hypothetical protein TrVE_jg1351 [Triparma verrucosa]